MAERRTAEQRKIDTLAKLGEHGADVWVASSSESGTPYLVPLSFAWVEGEVIIALERTSRTARNIEDAVDVRLGFGPTRDVVMIDAYHDETEDVDSSTWADAYAAQADWDPRGIAGMVFMRLRPKRIQAWRESNELQGRTLMTNGHWDI